MKAMPGWTALCCLLVTLPARAWSPEGHQTVGAIADRLLAGSHAAAEVRGILGDEPLQVAALWADCVKSVREKAPHRYVANPRYRECEAFQTPEGEREMEDYVVRNLAACAPQPGQESCHKQYHYTDVAVQRGVYARGQAGTSDHDIVAAIQACIEVLHGRAAPSPFEIRSRREALRLLAHLVGDIHQPLHVGVVYLDGSGRPVDPDRDGFREDSDTHGGNALVASGGARLHAQWDGIPPRLHAMAFGDAGSGLAKAVKRSPGEPGTWPVAWATETLLVSRDVHAGLAYGLREQGESGHASWGVRETVRTALPHDLLKERQLVKAGARLAQLLEAIWP